MTSRRSSPIHGDSSGSDNHRAEPLRWPGLQALRTIRRTSSLRITGLVEDQDGIIWMGTEAGELSTGRATCSSRPGSPSRGRPARKGRSI